MIVVALSQAAFSPLSCPPVPGSSGRVLPGTRLKVIDSATGELLGPGQEGELCVAGPQAISSSHLTLALRARPNT